MAIDAWATAMNRPRDEIRAERDRLVPLGGKMGTAWDVAYASLFLHSNEAGFITGAVLPVDGGQLDAHRGVGESRTPGEASVPPAPHLAVPAVVPE